MKPTARDIIHTDGSAQLFRFRPEGVPDDNRPAVLLIPSLINRWYVLDLREGASLVSACVDAGLDTYCLDWGQPEDEDRYLTWEDVLGRLGRALRKVKRFSGQSEVGALGYCMGGTLTSIYAALYPEAMAAMINLAGPVDFEHAGTLGVMTDPRWFDVEAIADAGNVSPDQMQSGFVALRPTGQVSKWVTLADRVFKPGFLDSFRALDTWANDNVSFPAAAYKTYIEDLYQKNLLVQGKHYVGARRVDLSEIEIPVMTIAASRDHICPEEAARGLHDAVGSKDKEMVVVPGGHVGAVVGSRAQRELYPKITKFFADRLQVEEKPKAKKKSKSSKKAKKAKANESPDAEDGAQTSPSA